MNFFKFIFLLFTFLIFSACGDLSFNDEDFVSPEEKPNKVKNKEAPNVTKNSQQISEEETTILSEDLELSENTIIQNKKVVLDMMTIQTLQHDLTIIAEEFISSHSFIQSFSEGQTAKEKEDGRSGGHVLIKAKTSKGSLGLILSGENGGYVPTRQISRSERAKLSGRNGANGYDAIYDTWCRDFYIPFGLGIFGGRIVLDRNCWQKCRVNPTRGRSGENGRQGYPGYTGKRGGDSGSFYLQAFNLSDFHLTDVKKTPGLGSKGGKGSIGGYGGARGKNGRDRKRLCSSNFPNPKSGRRGYRGKLGKTGESGKEGAVCLESLKSQKQQVKANNNQSEEIKCKENKSGIMCPEILAENKPAQDLKEKENVICY